jgi:hypothetical protein
MADPRAYPDNAEDGDTERDRAPADGTPRWAKLFAIIGVAVLLLLLVLLVVRGGHGPGRHTGGMMDAPRLLTPPDV